MCQIRSERVPREGAAALLDDEAGVAQKAEMARNARLRQTEHGRQLRHVQRLERQDAQQAKPGLVAEQPEEA